MVSSTNIEYLELYKMTAVVELAAQVVQTAQGLGWLEDASHTKLHENLFSIHALFSCKWFKDRAAGKDFEEGYTIAQHIIDSRDFLRVHFYENIKWFNDNR